MDTTKLTREEALRRWNASKAEPINIRSLPVIFLKKNRR